MGTRVWQNKTEQRNSYRLVICVKSHQNNKLRHTAHLPKSINEQ